MPRELPRPIKPELVQVGDKITVTYPPVDGVVMTHTGVVSAREDHGAVRFLRTAEGGNLVAWEVGKPQLSITLLDRPPAPQEPLSMFADMVAERLS